jgi:hypothetical protein
MCGCGRKKKTAYKKRQEKFAKRLRIMAEVRGKDLIKLKDNKNANR